VHQVVDGSTAALSGDREPAILDKRPGVAEVVDVLSRSPATGCVASADDVRPAFIEDQAAAPKRLGKIGTRLLWLLLGHPMSLGAPVSCRQPTT